MKIRLGIAELDANDSKLHVYVTGRIRDLRSQGSDIHAHQDENRWRALLVISQLGLQFLPIDIDIGSEVRLRFDGIAWERSLARTFPHCRHRAAQVQ
jgi:hypothetical protein